MLRTSVGTPMKADLGCYGDSPEGKALNCAFRWSCAGTPVLGYGV